MDSIKHFTIGAHEVPFTIERSNVRTITAFVGELLGVHIVLRVADSAHNTVFYDITLTRGENSITFRSVHELLLSSTVSFNVADLNRLSPVDAFNAGLLVNFYPDKTRTYETIAGYVRVYFSHDRALYCFAREEVIEDLPDVAWRCQGRHHRAWDSLECGAFDTGLAFITHHLIQMLSYIKEV